MNAFKTHGAFSWCELSTDDPEAAVAFYGKLFGWKHETMDMGTGPYHVIKAGDESIGGVSAKMPEMAKMPSMWGCYVTVDDVDKTCAECKQLGGKVLMAPMEVPGVGRMALLQDPQGALISAITYAMDDAP